MLCRGPSGSAGNNQLDKGSIGDEESGISPRIQKKNSRLQHPGAHFVLNATAASARILNVKTNLYFSHTIKTRPIPAVGILIRLISKPQLAPGYFYRILEMARIPSLRELRSPPKYVLASILCSCGGFLFG